MENMNLGNFANQTVSMFPLLPTNTTVWFALLEKQFNVAQITDDDVKFVTLAKCLEGRYLQHIEDILANLPAIGSYEKLKRALIRPLTDTDNAGAKKMVENKEMGDRKPSQFYEHLKELASPSTPRRFHPLAVEQSITRPY